MYLSEQIGDLEQTIRLALQQQQSQMWTALPAVVKTWNYPTNGQNTVHCMSGVMSQQLQQDGTWLNKPYPEFMDVPVHYLGGGNFYFTHPIKANDEGILVFASRCIDSWWQNGGQQARPSYGANRMHSKSDGMFIPTRLSHANVLPNISKTSSQLRSTDGSSYLEMLDNGGGFNFITPGGFVKIDGNGNLTASGEITRGVGTGDSVTVGQHTHDQPNDSDDDTEATTNKPNSGT